MRCYISFLLIFFWKFGVSQETRFLHFFPKVNDKKLEINQIYHLQDQEISISNFKFYLTELSFFQGDSLVAKDKRQAYLINALDSTSMVIPLAPNILYDQIKFKIGVDSLTSISGVFDGDLDPVNGMYWTWQSGYINFKLEGKSSNCPARLQKFYWHIGGYLLPFDAQREVTLETPGLGNIDIDIPLDKLINRVDMSQTYHVMSPSQAALNMADIIPSIFVKR